MPIRSPAAKRSPPLDHRSDDLMPGDERQLGVGQLAVHDVQVGPADAARGDPDEDLVLGRLRLGELDAARAGGRSR